MIFVVGASSGIGYSVAEELIKEGATVIAAARTFDKLANLMETLNHRKQGNFVPVKLDVTDRYQVLRDYLYYMEKFNAGNRYFTLRFQKCRIVNVGKRVMLVVERCQGKFREYLFPFSIILYRYIIFFFLISSFYC